MAKAAAEAAKAAADAAKAATVSAVSGEQILKAIVDAAKDGGGKVADVKNAKNPIEAAIGSSGEQNADGGEKGNEDAGKLFATKKNDEGGDAAAAEKAGEEGKLNAADGAKEGNADAGKLFATKKNDGANGGGDAAAAGKAAAAVSAVSGEQILKAIVDAAKDGGGKKAVEDVKDAENPIAAAIGSSGANKNAAEFATDGMKKDDQIAAAIVLRGMAKDGEFALTNDEHANAKGTVKNVVESEIKEISEWLEEMAKAAADAAKACC
ncbi:variable large family protein [Borreliella garinii]|uniref:variable large family protein n=1 Tax=Borreliella garinii TaxID=29519 RepID=UPI002B289F3A|nr:variable large family protein [Borreliella garinii]